MRKIQRVASSSFADDEDLKHNIYKVLWWEFMFYVLWLLFIYFCHSFKKQNPYYYSGLKASHLLIQFSKPLSSLESY